MTTLASASDPLFYGNIVPLKAVASQWGRKGGGYSPPIGMSTKMQNGKNTMFLALLRLLNALQWTK